MKNRGRFFPLITYMVILFVALSWLGNLFGTTGNSIPYSEVVSLFRQEQVQEFLVEGDQLTMILNTPYKGETRVSTTLSDPDGFRAEMQESVYRTCWLSFLLQLSFCCSSYVIVRHKVLMMVLVVVAAH